MDMRLNSKRIKSEREKRAWSQEHLANVSGLGVRTIHRIESTGTASLESIKALASVFELEISQLQDSSNTSLSFPRELTWTKLLWVLLNSPVKLMLEKDTRKANLIRLITMLLCLLGAIGSYALGSSTGIGIFIVVGAFFEIALAFRLTEGSRPSNLDA